MLSPAIVVVAFNRPYSLKRLLESLAVSHYSISTINLVISIDYQSSESHAEVIEVAQRFIWNHGIKSIIEYKENQGLRNHIINCGDLTNQFGSIIMLEDDLMVSPYFYSYAMQSLEYYGKDERIGGVSLYSHKRNFNNGLPFELIAEDGDFFFLQIASSWGQAWTFRQWSDFRKWYQKNSTMDRQSRISPHIISWPDTSWLKHFIKFLQEENKYFVFPKNSYSTNFGDAGTHNAINNTVYQVPLVFDQSYDYRFVNLESSLNIYDCYFELLPRIITQRVRNFPIEDFLVDVYGLKNLELFPERYVLSSKKIKSNAFIKSYGFSLKPLMMNIISDIDGEIFHLAERSEFINDYEGKKITQTLTNHFFAPTTIKELLKTLTKKIIGKYLGIK